MKSNHLISINRMMKEVWNHCRTCAWILVLMLFLTACGSSTTPGWQEQYDLGMQYLTEGDYSAAVVALTAAIETEPKMAALYIARGDAYSAWAEEVLSTALDALADGEILEWTAIAVTTDDGSTYTLEELYENAISDYEKAIVLIENGETVDDSPEELSEEAEEKRLQTEKKRDEGREEYAEKLDELISADDEADAQEDETGNSEEESERTDESELDKTVDYSVIYQNYEDCSEEEQSVITMLVDAAESGDLDSLPLLSEIPEFTGYYYYDGYRVHITGGYTSFSSYIIVSVRPQSGMGYAYFICEDYELSMLRKKGYYNYDYCSRETDYIACPCEDWNWNGEYTETYILLYDVVESSKDIGYETGSAADGLLNGTISTTVTTSDAVYTWTCLYEGGEIVDSSGTEGGWDENYFSFGYFSTEEEILKYFWLDEAYCIICKYDSNDNLTEKCTYNSAGELIGYLLNYYDEDGKLESYIKYEDGFRVQWPYQPADRR